MGDIFGQLLAFADWLWSSPVLRWFLVAGLAALALVAAVVSFLLLRGITQMFRALRRTPRKPCHQCYQPTQRRTPDDNQVCAAGQPCCENCADEHLFRLCPEYACPACGEWMGKDIAFDQVVCYCLDDRCTGPVILPDRQSLNEVYAMGYEDGGHRRSSRSLKDKLLSGNP